MATHNTPGVHGIQGDEWDSALNDCFYFVDIINAVDTVQLVPSTRMATSELKSSHCTGTVDKKG